MTIDETLIFMGILKTAYPRYYANIDKTEAKQAVMLWSEMLQDISLDQAKLALKKYIASSPFPPTVSDIRQAITVVTSGYIPDEGEAWGEVLNAIRLYGYMQPDKAYDNMGEYTKLAVKRMGWQSLCESENQMADRAHFMSIYKSIKQREESNQALPYAIREQIAQNIASNMPRLKAPEPQPMPQIETQTKPEDLEQVGDIIQSMRTQLGGQA